MRPRQHTHAARRAARVASAAERTAVSGHLKMQMPPLLTSKERKEVGGRPSALQMRARRMLLCVTTKCCVPGASNTSARADRRLLNAQNMKEACSLSLEPVTQRHMVPVCQVKVVCAMGAAATAAGGNPQHCSGQHSSAKNSPTPKPLPDAAIPAGLTELWLVRLNA